MTSSYLDQDTIETIIRLAREGRTITSIANQLEISWSDASRHTPNWRGAKARITIRLNKLATERDPAKRKKLAEEADVYVDFLYDAAKHLRSQVNSARNALNR